MTPPRGKLGRNGPAYRRLKHLLVNYQFLPGEQLQVAELADRLGVSSTPVREALNRLYAEALLMSVPNRGFFAKTLNAQEMNELLELAFVLLRHSVGKDIAGFTLMGINQPIALSLDPEGRVINVTEDILTSHALFQEQLFERIVSLSKNEAMMVVIRNFNDRTHYVRLIDLGLPGHIDIASERILALIGQLQRRDANGACGTLSAERDRMLAAMPQLVREGIGRRYS